MSLSQSFKNLSITTQFVVWFLLIATIPMFIITYVTLVESQKTLESQRLETLRGMADAKANLIQNFFFEREREVTLLAKTSEVVDAMVQFDNTFELGVDSSEYLEVDSEFRPFLSYVQRTPEYYDVLFISPDGDVIFTVIHESDFGTNVVTGRYKNTEIARIFDRVQGLLQTEISDFAYYDPSGIPAAFVAAPVFKDSAFVGVVVLQFSNQRVYDIVQDYSGLGETGETVLGTITGDGVVFISPLRFGADAAFERTVVLGSSEALPMQAAVQGERGEGITTDYQGEEILAAWSYLAPLRWGMVTKINTSEVFAPAQQLIKAALIADGILYLLVIFLSIVLAHSVTKPIRSLTGLANNIAKGDLDTKASVDSKNEIGQLGEALNVMINRLKESRGVLEKKVKERTASLEIEKKRSEILLASIGDAVFAIDKEQNTIFLNPRAEELSGYSSAEIIGKSYYDYLKFVREKDGTESYDFIRNALKGQIAKMQNHTVLVKKDGSKLPVADVATPLKDTEGNILGAIVVFRDVTQERDIERMRKEMISLASHQLKGPLTIISGNVELMEESKLSLKERAEILADIKLTTEGMKKLVEDLLNISRIEQGSIELKPELCQFEIIVDKAVETLSPIIEKLKVSIDSNEPTETLPKINVDPKYLGEAIQNIIHNAVKYTKGRVVITYEKQKDSILFACNDNGLGIPKEEQSKVFGKFFRASNVTKSDTEGTGLGLSITKTIIEKLGGKVWFESEENVGTTFYVSFPLTEVATTKTSEG